MINTVTEGDCLDLLPRVASGSVDMVLCDLPYGTTRNVWDAGAKPICDMRPCDRAEWRGPIDLTTLWCEYRRLLRAGGVVVLTAAQPFSSILVTANISWFRYEWVWEKEAGTGFLNAKKQPLRSHEQALVFYDRLPMYNPQMELGKPYTQKKGSISTNYKGNSAGHATVTTVNEGLRYPKTVLRFQRDRPQLHPTQKPVALWEYLIRTYTNEGDTVLDNCCGSGTTGVACKNTGRNFIQFEISPEYCDIAKSRLGLANETTKSTKEIAVSLLTTMSRLKYPHSAKWLTEKIEAKDANVVAVILQRLILAGKVVEEDGKYRRYPK